MPPSLWAQATGTLAGTIVDGTTHNPIARVLVDASSYGAMLTDGAGRFSFPNVPLGNATVSYRRPGYSDALTGAPEGSRSLVVGQAAGDQALEMQADASLHGQLALSDGDTPVNMRVDLYRAHITGGRRHWLIQGTTTVHADGSFAFEGLAADSYIVHGEASLDPAPAAGTGRVRSGYAPAFAPDTGDINAATVYTLGPGQSAEVRLRAARVPFYPVAIAVGDEPPGNLQIMGNGFTDWTPRFRRELDALTTELPSGNYTLRSQGGRQTSAGEVSFHVDGAPLSGSALTMSSSLPISVVQNVVQNAAATTQGGTAPQPPRLSSLTFLPVAASYLPNIDDSVQLDPGSQTAVLRRSIPPGQYWVTGRAVGGYISALQSGGTDLFTQPFVVTAGTSLTIEATLRQDTGTVSVTRAGEVLAHPAVMQLLPIEPGGASLETTANTTGEANGSVVIGSVPPGDYLLVALAADTSIAYRAPGVMQALRGTRVTVTPGGAAQATVSTFTALPASVVGAR